jgi:type I restriction enzyme R subunit
MTKENNIEDSLIQQLVDQKYSYRPDIKNRESLEKNFRQKFETLNRVKLSDSEFNRLKEDIIQPDEFNAAKILRNRNTFYREDGTPLQYTLVNIKDWCKNEFEVINQLRINTESSNHRYDVILLLNGLPLVQIELKTYEISPRKAMQQIVDYKNDAGNGYRNSLLCFMQLFIVSNRNNTYYFANNRNQHFIFNADEQFLPIYQYADHKNNKITSLDKFTCKFLAKCTLGEMISRYMVLVETEQKILVMRPYQIYAVEAIVNCIDENRGNGYIWHTTGSGKTLTSFKTSTLLKGNPNIEKCLFVVDRKDLDRQTRQEFNKFQDGSVEENTNTESLVRRLLSTDYADKVIVTTIQKLGIALDSKNKNNYAERLAPLKDKRVVFIFDECHRSQFGENHQAIKEFFPNAQLFGFTGTPIFDENASYKKVDGQEGRYQTTKDIFKQELHTYTITHAIDDKNVLRFHIDYFKADGVPKEQITEAGARKAVAEAILKKHDSATNQRKFNAILATASINNAIAYYQLFEELQAERIADSVDYRPLNITCVFSPPAQAIAQSGDSNAQKNAADIKQLQEDLTQEAADNRINPDEKKEALKKIIADYNKQYGSNHTINEFDLYYQDVQVRIKMQQYSNRDVPHAKKIDIIIVVDMLLTGFDSKYLNTLYVDKNLNYHGLIQAFSRTNRVLNDTKPYGNIMDFRYQRVAVEKAILRFSDGDLNQAREIWLVDEAPVVIEKYQDSVAKLNDFMSSQGLTCTPDQVSNLRGEVARVEFLQKFKEVQRLKTQLEQYTDLDAAQAQQIETALPEDTLRGFRGMYLETAQQLRQAEKGKDKPQESLAEQLDFEFVLFTSSLIDYDYIMTLIAEYTQRDPKKHKMSKEKLISFLSSSANLLEERDVMIAYINQLPLDEALGEKAIRDGYQLFKRQQQDADLKAIATKHDILLDHLKPLVELVMLRKVFDGEKLNDLTDHLDLGWKARAQKELALMEDLVPYLKQLAEGQEIAGLKAYE